MTKHIKTDELYYPYQMKKAGCLIIKEDTFGGWQTEMPSDTDIIDYTGYSIAPGLVDTHTHGSAGTDAMDNSKGAPEAMSHVLLGAGMTDFLPTGLAASFEALDDICHAVADFAGQESDTRIQGLFFEGPYSAEKYKEVQNPPYMRNPSIVELGRWLESSRGLLRKIALAPERDDVADFINHARKKNMVIVLRHSGTTYEQAVNAVEADASVWTHAYNGMRGLNHRKSGMVGAVYGLSNIYAELICDGHHIHPPTCDILIHQKDYDHVALIADCISAGGPKDGDYMLGKYPVTVEKGTARLKSNGASAGSTLQLRDTVEDVANWRIAPKVQAVNVVSLIPVVSAGINGKRGQTKKGHQADFIIFDKELNLQTTYLGGKKIWNA